MNLSRRQALLGSGALAAALSGCAKTPEAVFDIADRHIYQLGFLVEDLDTAMQQWISQYGVGPFFTARHFQFLKPSYRGTASAPDVSLAFAYSGGLMLELIQQHDATPSVYTEMRQQRGYGFHHIAFLSSDLDTSIARSQQRALPLVFRADYPGGRLAYCESRGLLGGGFVEYVERSDTQRALLDMMHKTAADWDGSDAVRPLMP